MEKFNIVEAGTGRQANNLLINTISDAISPWFADVSQDQRVREAIAALADETAGSCRPVLRSAATSGSLRRCR